MQASVVGSPVLDLLRVEGSRRCDDRRALLGYSSYDSDNDLEAASIKRFNGKARQVSATIVYMMVLKFTWWCHTLDAQAAAKKAGYHSPTSMESPEKIYASPSEDSPSEDEGEYEDEPPPRRELTAAEKREFEEEIDALSSHSSDPEGPEDSGDT
jgi:hypothetical protein